MIKVFALLMPVTLLLNACSATKSDSEKQWVYINNGALQCQETAKSAIQTASILSEQGVHVSDSKCAELTNVMVAAMCGAPRGDINLHLIDKKHIAHAEKLGYLPVNSLKQGDELGYKNTACN